MKAKYFSQNIFITITELHPLHKHSSCPLQQSREGRAFAQGCTLVTSKNTDVVRVSQTPVFKVLFHLQGTVDSFIYFPSSFSFFLLPP